MARGWYGKDSGERDNQAIGIRLARLGDCPGRHDVYANTVCTVGPEYLQYI